MKSCCFIMPYLKFDSLSTFVGLFIAFFTLLITVYSFGFMDRKRNLSGYYLYILLTLIASLGVVFSNNLILLIVFWGFLGMPLYMLIGYGNKKRTSATAKKAFIIIGGTDALMLLGIGLIKYMTGTLQMDQLSIAINSKPAMLAYLCLAAGAFAKAGAMPFHTWVPDTAEDAPTPVVAFLPASLDKLLGIYLLARISLDIFKLNFAMNTILMALGSITIFAAVMMALVQHDLKRLLGYHAVSQVGYMILGIGTGNPIGIAGGLFHMLNNAIYKSCLFLSGGSVEKKAGTTDLGKLGGLAKIMPVTFVTFLIASFAISGIPPFNGFVSKWMIYQGIVEVGRSGDNLWILWLVAAMFGSALTLASFMKLIHAIFLGQSSRQVQVSDVKKSKEVTPLMWVPQVALALLCVLFGVFASRMPLNLFVFPGIRGSVRFLGIWNAGLATFLLLIGIMFGIIIYFIGTGRKAKESEIFVGGEILKDIPEMRVSGTQFYNTIKELYFLRAAYKLAEKKLFDIYDVGTKITLGFNKMLSFLHNGVLPTYLTWCLLGMGILLYFLVK